MVLRSDLARFRIEHEVYCSQEVVSANSKVHALAALTLPFWNLFTIL